MTPADLPGWAALSTALLVLLGAGLTLIGSVGLLRLGSFYERVHAPTLGSTLGAVGVLLGSILYFSVQGGRPALHEVLIAVFITVTTPVTLMLLVQAAQQRDRFEGRDHDPAAAAPDDEDGSARPGRAEA